jgi:hypothetical protein
MRCPICQARPAKRKCPARGDTICAVCCGTKRLVEIRCPADCGYLASARSHPPAVTERQHQRDVALLLPAMRELTERQSRFFFLFQSILIRHQSDPLRPVLDPDVVDAASSLARSLETAARGVIYDQRPASITAQELAASFRHAFDEVTTQIEGARTPLERDAARALRGIEEAAKRVGALVGDERQGFLDLARRLLKSDVTAPGNLRPSAGSGTDGSILLP